MVKVEGSSDFWKNTNIKLSKDTEKKLKSLKILKNNCPR